MMAPYLLKRHRKDRFQWSKESLQLNFIKSLNGVDLEIFSPGQSKFNLDGPDGVACYWHDLREKRETFFTRNQAGELVMIWGAISYYGLSNLEGINTNMNSTGYCNILQRSLLPFAAETLGEVWTFQHDGASIPRSNETKKWLDKRTVNVLPWPAKFSNLNIIVNVWGCQPGRFTSMERITIRLRSWLIPSLPAGWK